MSKFQIKLYSGTCLEDVIHCSSEKVLFFIVDTWGDQDEINNSSIRVFSSAELTVKNK